MANRTKNPKKFLIKISGELFRQGDQPISYRSLGSLAQEIKSLKKRRNKLALVVGGGNIVRGRDFANGFDRVTVDYAGMTAAVVNGLMLKAALDSIGCPAVVDSTLAIGALGGSHQFDKLRLEFEAGKVVIMGGTGLPFVSTDTAAVIFALELGVELVLKATKVNGVYDKDPLKFPQAKFFKRVSFDKVTRERLNVMDQSAFVLAANNKLPIRVFKWKKGVLAKIAAGEEVGTFIS